MRDPPRRFRVGEDEADYVGAFPLRQDISVLPADDPRGLRIGWTIYEEVGVVIINDQAIARVQVTGDYPPPIASTPFPYTPPITPTPLAPQIVQMPLTDAPIGDIIPSRWPSRWEEI